MFTASPFANSERTYPADKQMNQPPLPLPLCISMESSCSSLGQFVNIEFDSYQESWPS